MPHCLTMKERVHVVVVDDHTLMREGLEEILVKDSEDRFELTGAFANGKEFIDALEHIKCDVVILDIQMPVKGGESTLDHLRACFPNIKALMLSSLDQHFQVGICIKLGAKGFLPKHVTSAELKKAILTVHKGDYFFNELLSPASLEEFQSKKKELVRLSLQESKIIQLVAEGKTTDEIAEYMNLSRHTVKTYRERALSKTGTSNMMELYHFAVSNGFIKSFPK